MVKNDSKFSSLGDFIDINIIITERENREKNREKR